MTTLKHSNGKHPALVASMSDATDDEDTIEGRRARRMKALLPVAGLWVNRKDIPADGLEYQQAMRAEWP